jgi:hypothetical protein
VYFFAGTKLKRNYIWGTRIKKFEYDCSGRWGKRNVRIQVTVYEAVCSLRRYCSRRCAILSISIHSLCIFIAAILFPLSVLLVVVRHCSALAPQSHICFYLFICIVCQSFWLLEHRFTNYWGPSVSCGSSVGIATAYGLDDRRVGVRVQARSRILPSADPPDQFWGSPYLLSIRYRGLFPCG